MSIVLTFTLFCQIKARSLIPPYLNLFTHCWKRSNRNSSYGFAAKAGYLLVSSCFYFGLFPYGFSVRTMIEFFSWQTAYQPSFHLKNVKRSSAWLDCHPHQDFRSPSWSPQRSGVKQLQTKVPRNVCPCSGELWPQNTTQQQHIVILLVKDSFQNLGTRRPPCYENTTQVVSCLFWNHAFGIYYCRTPRMASSVG